MQFSKTTGRIKEAIDALPVANEYDDKEEAAALKDKSDCVHADAKVNEEPLPSAMMTKSRILSGLNALISDTPVKEAKLKGKTEALSSNRNSE